MIYHAFLNGEGVHEQLSDYSITDTVTSLIPGNSPGVPGFDFTVPDPHINPHRFIRTRGALLLDVPIVGTVNQISHDESSDLSTYTFDSDLQQLNKFLRTFRVQGDLSLFNTIDYTILASLPDDIVYEMLGNAYVQSLRSYFPDVYENGLDAIFNILAANRLEMHTSYTFDPVTSAAELRVEIREPFLIDLYVSEFETLDVSTDDSNRAANVEVTNYDYHYANNDIVWKSDSVYQIAASEYQEVSVTMAATPQTIIQPVCVSTMLPPTGYDPPSKYVITGNDGYIVSPAFWTDNGGKIEAELDPENPKNLLLKITACSELSRSPYRISEGEADRPSLAIAGTGVVENPQPFVSPTGDEYAPADEQSLDTSAVGTIEQTHNMVNALIHLHGQPKQTLTATFKKNKYKMFSREQRVWDTLLPQQIASAGRKLGSAEGFYAPHELLPISEGLRVTVKNPDATAGNPILALDPGYAYPSVDPRYSLNPVILPNKRKSVQRLWLTPVAGSMQYGFSIRVRAAGPTTPFRVRTRYYDSGMNQVGTFLYSTSTLAAATNRSTVSTAPVNAAYVGYELETLVGTVATQIVVLGISLREGAAVVPPTTETVLPSAEVTTDFSNIVGAMFEYNKAMYRVTEATYVVDTVTITAEEHTTLADLDKIWAGKTIEQFDDVFEDYSFLQLGQRPLITEAGQ